MTLVCPGPRPRFRGVSHRLAFYVAVACGIVLVACTHDLRAAAATSIYVALLAAMLRTSAALHGADWDARTFGRLRRADHAMIFAFIAGTYTPLCLLGVRGAAGVHLLALAWGAAALGIVRALVWPHAPRAVTSILYIAVGWVALAYLPAVHAALAPAAFAAVVAGGATYTIGAAVYATRWPDPWPDAFGYHEVFHALIIVGCAFHFVAVALVATG